MVDHFHQTGYDLKIVEGDLSFPEDFVVAAVIFDYGPVLAQGIGRYVHIVVGCKCKKRFSRLD